MFKILLVEDEQFKIKSVFLLLEKIIDLNIDDVTHVMDANEAKKLMKVVHYDMLLLDIAIPLKKSQDADPLGGILLLNEILDRSDIYKIPTHITALSGKTDSFEAAVNKYGNGKISICKYEQNSDEWETSLLASIQHKVSSKRSQAFLKPEYNYDVAIICALEEELQANLDNGWEWEINNTLSHDDTVYYEATIPHLSGYKIIAARSMRMGMPAATTLTTKMVHNFRPRLVIMTGIMAGVSGKTQLGDSILGNPIWDWGSGKWTTEMEADNPVTSNSVFQIEPFQYKPDTKLVKFVELLQKDKNFFFTLRSSYKANSPKYDIGLLSGPIASGASVLANKDKFNDVLGQNRKLLGIEMEGYGLMCAADSVSAPKPLGMCIKTVVDYGDKEKADDFHGFGCYASAMIAKKIIEDFYLKEK